MYFCDYKDANFMITSNILQSTALFKATVGKEHTHTHTPFQLNSRRLSSTEEGVHALWGHVATKQGNYTNIPTLKQRVRREHYAAGGNSLFRNLHDLKQP